MLNANTLISDNWLTIVIPALNEEEAIGATIARAEQRCQSYVLG